MRWMSGSNRGRAHRRRGKPKPEGGNQTAAKSMDIKEKNCTGHPLIGPRGEQLRVPLWAYRELQKRGLKKRYSINLSPRIYDLLDPEFDSFQADSHGKTYGIDKDGRQIRTILVSDAAVRRLLGADLSGPAWCQCDSAECRGRA